MFTITKEYRTETGHRLHPYDGKCSHFHGHSYLWRVTVGAENLHPKTGMVADFGDLKKIMVDLLEPLDHCFIFNQDDPLVTSRSLAELESLLKATNGEDPRIWVAPFNPTAENLTDWLAQEITAATDLFTVYRVEVWETATSCAEWVAP